MLATLYSVCQNLNDFVSTSKVIAVSLGMSQMVVTIIICIIKQENLQVSSKLLLQG